MGPGSVTMFSKKSAEALLSFISPCIADKVNESALLAAEIEASLRLEENSKLTSTGAPSSQLLHGAFRTWCFTVGA